MRYYNKLLILAMIASIFNGCNSSSSTDDTTTQPTTIESKSLEPSGWYMRVTVEATTDDGKVYIHNNAGVFGELDESSDGLDKHDVPAKGTAIIQARFLNNELDSTTEYYSDYRSYDQNTTHKSWDIVIINDDNNIDLSDASIKIDIENIKDIYRINDIYKEVSSLDTTKRDSLKIIDLDNQTVYAYNELKDAKLSMEGKHQRKFRIILGEIEKDDMNTFKMIEHINKSYKVTSFEKGFGLPPQ